MERKIQVFKTFEEQEAFHLEQMRKSSAIERLRQLYALQQMTQALHPTKDFARKLTVRKWMY